MVTIEQVNNLFKYGSLNLIPQVDPEVMKPIFKAKISRLSFYSPEDYLTLQKTEKGNLIFQYSSSEYPFMGSRGIRFNGIIYAREPGKDFGGVNVLSFMKMDIFSPDSKGEIFDVIKGIVEEAGIEKVVASSLGVRIEDAKRLCEIKGHRPGGYLKDGSKLNDNNIGIPISRTNH